MTNESEGFDRRLCVFCGSPANSREHVIPEWLSKRMGIRDLGFHPAHYSEVEGYQIRPLIKCQHLRTKQVCDACNTGWMCELEAWAQSRFGQYVEPDFEFDHLIDLKAIRSEPNQLVRWMLKTAIMVELALPRGEIEKVVPLLYPVAMGNEEPQDFHVWAAYIHATRFDLHLLRGFPVWNGGVLEPHQIHAESMNFGLQMNHLALRLFRCPSGTAGVKFHVRYPDGFRAAPLLLTATGSLPFPNRYIYPTFDRFLEALEVHAKPPSGGKKTTDNHRQKCG